MVNEERVNDQVDPSVLKVVGRKKSGLESKSHVRELAGAILEVIGKYQNAKLRAVGGAAISNAIKAIGVAQKRFGEQSEVGDELFHQIHRIDVDFDGDIKTGSLFVVRPLSAINGE